MKAARSWGFFLLWLVLAGAGWSGWLLALLIAGAVGQARGAAAQSVLLGALAWLCAAGGAGLAARPDLWASCLPERWGAWGRVRVAMAGGRLAFGLSVLVMIPVGVAAPRQNLVEVVLSGLLLAVLAVAAWRRPDGQSSWLFWSANAMGVAPLLLAGAGAVAHRVPVLWLVAPVVAVPIQVWLWRRRELARRWAGALSAGVVARVRGGWIQFSDGRPDAVAPAHLPEGRQVVVLEGGDVGLTYRSAGRVEGDDVVAGKPGVLREKAWANVGVLDAYAASVGALVLAPLLIACAAGLLF